MSEGGFWPGEQPVAAEKDPYDEPEPEPAAEAEPEFDAEPEFEAEPDDEELEDEELEDEEEPEAEDGEDEEAEAEALHPEPAGHAPDELDIPDGFAVLEGAPSGAGRSVGVVVSRFNAEISDSLLAAALDALEAAGVPEERITVMPVPGAFELPIGAMALAKTRRYSCVVALGCVVRGETPHFDYVASETASGLQLAGLETGVPVAFGVLTVDDVEQARARTEKGAEAARTALEMADLFGQLRAQSKA